LKLTIEKLGRIQRAEIDVRPLTVFIGPNNTNKTWTAYALYGILLSLSRTLTPVPFHITSDEHDFWHSRLSRVLIPLYEALSATPIPKRVEVSILAQSIFGEADEIHGHDLSPDSIPYLLALPNGFLPGARAKLEYQRTEFAASLVSLDIIFERQLNRLQLKVNRKREYDSKHDAPIALVDEAWTEEKIFSAVILELMNLVEHVVVFPAERNGIVPVWPLLSSVDRLAVPVPVVYFGKFLGIAQALPATGSRTPAQIQLLKLLGSVVGGEITYTADAGRKNLVFRSANTEIPIHSAASLTRAVAGLAIYVDRFFQPDDILVIDELEMNAHPEAQVALTEFIAALVNAGVRVVLTTHSPYVVDHLNNLMEASRVPPERQEKLAQKFSLGTTSSFISPDKVAVHAFQEDKPGGEVKVSEVLNRASGLIDWSTFSRVSERITNLYSDVLRATGEDA
jgi:hypothetical protein